MMQLRSAGHQRRTSLTMVGLFAITLALGGCGHKSTKPSASVTTTSKPTAPVNVGIPAKAGAAVHGTASLQPTPAGHFNLPSIKPALGAPARVTAVSRIPVKFHSFTAAVQDARGRWWLGTEDQGVYCYDPHADQSPRWQHIETSHGGEANVLSTSDEAAPRWQHFMDVDGAPRHVYALACDALGRIWAGSLSHGVCVFNGRQWRDYNLAAGVGYHPKTAAGGPMGGRIFTIATSPVDASVWIASARGLARYRITRRSWQYYVPGKIAAVGAQGLPSDAISSLAFAPDGTLFVGTQASGIAASSPASHYRDWRRVTGPLHLPIKPTGSGLPTNMINALAVVPLSRKAGGRWRYRVYAGTDAGLAIGEDNGHTWRFIRGRDYLAKIKGLWHPPAQYPHPDAAALKRLVTSEEITCLAVDADGNLWMGHRTSGFEVWNLKANRIYSSANASPPDVVGKRYVASLAPLAGGGMLIGGYGFGGGNGGGGGAFKADESWQGQGSAHVTDSDANKTAHFPAGAGAPSRFELKQLLVSVRKSQGKPVQAAYLGQDWRTKGDWIGRYGLSFARLCAGTRDYENAAEEYHSVPSDTDIIRESSPHQGRGDVAYYAAWYHSGLERTLYFPGLGMRVEAEWNDAGGRYPRFFDGPDMWLKVKIPRGLYRLSFYFHNKDAHNGLNALRDFPVRVYPKGSDPATALAKQQPLAQGRVMQFWGGEYISFILQGPGPYQVRLQRNYGHWMTVAGMFLDRLDGPDNLMNFTHPDGLVVSYHPPVVKPKKAVRDSAAWQLWQLLDEPQSYSHADLPLQYPARLLAYRYAQAQHLPAALLERWRWRLHLWTSADRNAFHHVMSVLSANAAKLRTNTISP